METHPRELAHPSDCALCVKGFLPADCIYICSRLVFIRMKGEVAMKAHLPALLPLDALKGISLGSPVGDPGKLLLIM